MASGPTVSLYKKGGGVAFLQRIKQALIGPTTYEVGLPKDAVDKDIIQRAAWNEFGTKRIPARPFMRISTESNRRKYELNFIRDARRLSVGATTIRQVLDEAGREAAQDMKKTIDNFVPPRNAASTVRKKGFDHPLIETGEMKDAITYKLR